jgi:peptidase C39-like protein
MRTLTLASLLVCVAAGCSGGRGSDFPAAAAAAGYGGDDGGDGNVVAASVDLGQAPSSGDIADLATPPPPVKRVLEVSWQGQATYYWCGPASTRMALSTRIAPPSQQTLASYLGTTTDGTDDISLVRDALNHYLGTTWFEAKYLPDPPSQAERDRLKYDIVYNIDHGYPLVANVVSGWRPPGYPGGTIYHYVAIVGYDASGDKVLIADPAGNGAGGTSWSNVPATYWISTYDLGTWIGGKGYTA